MNTNFVKPNFNEISQYLSRLEYVLGEEYLVCDVIDLAAGVYKSLDSYFDIPGIKVFTELSSSCYGYHSGGVGICITSFGIKQDLIRTFQTILHEYRHNVQNNARINYTKFSGEAKNLATAFKVNLEKYFSGDGKYENFIIYYFQLVEEDANTFAFDAITTYLKDKTDPKYAASKKLHAENINQYLSYVESAKALFGPDFRAKINEFVFRR